MSPFFTADYETMICCINCHLPFILYQPCIIIVRPVIPKKRVASCSVLLWQSLSRLAYLDTVYHRPLILPSLAQPSKTCFISARRKWLNCSMFTSITGKMTQTTKFHYIGLLFHLGLWPTTHTFKCSVRKARKCSYTNNFATKYLCTP